MLDLGLRIVEIIMILDELQWTASGYLFVHSFRRKCWLLAQITLSVDNKCITRFLHPEHSLSGAHNCGSWKLKFNERGGRGAGSMIESWNIGMCTIRWLLVSSWPLPIWVFVDFCKILVIMTICITFPEYSDTQ